MLSLWQLGMESLQLSGLSALDTGQGQRPGDRRRWARASPTRSMWAAIDAKFGRGRRNSTAATGFAAHRRVRGSASIFFDGMTSARHDARVTLGASGLAHRRPPTAALLAEWPYDEIEEPAGAGPACCASGAAATRCWSGWRSSTPRFAAAIDARAAHVDRSGARATPPAGKRDRLDRGRHRCRCWRSAISACRRSPTGWRRWCRRASSASSATPSTCRCAACSTATISGAGFECGAAPSERAGPRRARRDDAAAGGRRRRCGCRSPRRWCGGARPTPSRCRAAHIYVFEGLIRRPTMPTSSPA